MQTDGDKIQRQRRERQRRYRARHKSFSLSYSQEEAIELKKEAKRYKMNIPKYIKTVVEAHLGGYGYVLPPESKLEDLIFILRKIGNNINQHTRYVHGSREVKYSDIEMLQNKLIEIENHIVQSLSIPQEITEVLQEYLNQNPERLYNLITWLNNYDHQDTTD